MAISYLELGKALQRARLRELPDINNVIVKPRISMRRDSKFSNGKCRLWWHHIIYSRAHPSHFKFNRDPPLGWLGQLPGTYPDHEYFYRPECEKN
jgi:hypothetical protein